MIVDAIEKQQVKVYIQVQCRSEALDQRNGATRALLELEPCASVLSKGTVFQEKGKAFLRFAGQGIDRAAPHWENQRLAALRLRPENSDLSGYCRFLATPSALRPDYRSFIAT